LILIKRT